MNLKNKCLATIYDLVLKHKNIREIHKEILKMTINNKKMTKFMVKVADKSVKVVKNNATKDENGVILLLLFNKQRYNSKCKKIINQEVNEIAENQKETVIKQYIKDSEDHNKWIYLASSHEDCALDHKPYQGKLYYDDKAPINIANYCRNKGMMSIQWVMDKPAWFITRPNCRHFFVALNKDVVDKYSLKELQRRYKTHGMTGDKTLKTPRTLAIEEYKDRLKLLEMMYSKHPTEHLRREIQKIKLLLRKWEHKL